MATRSSNFILPASALVAQSPPSLSSSQTIDCRFHSPQSSPTKDKKDLPLLQVPGQSGRFCSLGQHRRRDVCAGAMLYNSNVEAGSDEAEDDVEQTCHPLERGLLNQQQVSHDGNLPWELKTEHCVAGSMDQINSSHAAGPAVVFQGSRVNGNGWIPLRDHYRKGNKQYFPHAGVSLASVRDRDGNQESYNAHSSEGKSHNHHPTVTKIEPEDRNPHEVLQEAKGKEIAGCILAIKRLRLACTRTISKTLRSFKGTIIDDRKAADGILTSDETDPEPRIPEESGEAIESEKPSGSTRDEELDEIPWDVLKRLWENPAFVKFRVSISMANLTMALPTFLSRALPLLSSSPLKGFSFPVLAPLLFGGGIVFKSAVSNLGFVLPRMLMSMAIMWVLWALNHVIQDAIQHLRDNGSFDRRVASVLVLFFELTFSAIAVVTVLSSIGLNVNSLLLPSFLALALAGKDVWQNYFAGFFLFAAQPFRPGHTVALMCGQETTRASPTTNIGMMKSGWFEGVCEAVDLRYTVLRNGRHRLMVPNAIFVKRSFLIIDPEPQPPPSESSKKQQSPRAKPKHRPNKVDSAIKNCSPPTSSSAPSLSPIGPDPRVGAALGVGSVSKRPSADLNGSALPHG
ncbi:hypothetical protein Mapa_001628 [Marchantia paleacea]|nr:hypothetical protein Mapa_001628 [Marchantia paleacea]